MLLVHGIPTKITRTNMRMAPLGKWGECSYCIYAPPPPPLRFLVKRPHSNLAPPIPAKKTCTLHTSCYLHYLHQNTNYDGSIMCPKVYSHLHPEKRVSTLALVYRPCYDGPGPPRFDDNPPTTYTAPLPRVCRGERGGSGSPITRVTSIREIASVPQVNLEASFLLVPYDHLVPVLKKLSR